MAERLSTVSRSVSPLDWEDAAILRLTTSADSRLAAISKVVWVRVLGSKKRLNMDFPRSSGTFLISRSVTPTKDSAVSSIFSRMGDGSPSVVRRCCSSPCLFSCGFLFIVLRGSCCTGSGSIFRHSPAPRPTSFLLVRQSLPPQTEQ